MIDDFKPWMGGECPVPIDDAVDIKLRSGRVLMNIAARYVLWGRPRRELDAANDNFVNGGAIVAYRRTAEAA